jgi:hypothetical protein
MALTPASINFTAIAAEIPLPPLLLSLAQIVFCIIAIRQAIAKISIASGLNALLQGIEVQNQRVGFEQVNYAQTFINAIL